MIKPTKSQGSGRTPHDLPLDDRVVTRPSQDHLLTIAAEPFGLYNQQPHLDSEPVPLSRGNAPCCINEAPQRHRSSLAIVAKNGKPIQGIKRITWLHQTPMHQFQNIALQ